MEAAGVAMGVVDKGVGVGVGVGVEKAPLEARGGDWLAALLTRSCTTSARTHTVLPDRMRTV